jgi:two-component system, LytTR family, response regulator LytT
MKIRCIAVDDEPLALRLLSTFIKQTPFLELVQTYPNAVEALAGIEQENIQLLFLDIQMPELTGMDLAKVLASGGHPPRIIFTTAYNHFAIEGYKVDALDYLLKPFSYDEFLRAATKARSYFESTGQQTQIKPVEENFLFIKADYKMLRVDFENILFIESLKDYIKIHLADKTKPLMTLSSLRSIEEKLPAARFVRLHRSFIVAIDKIDAITKSSVHIGDATITVGEQYKEVFRELMNKWL